MYYKVYYTHQIFKKSKTFKDGILALDRRLDEEGQIETRDPHTNPSNTSNYLKILGQLKETKTLSLQAILRPGRARLFDDNGKEIKNRPNFSADFDPTSQSYRGMMDNLLVEFDGMEDVWDFEPEEFRSGKCFLGHPLTRTEHS